jgi:Transposase DDE domain
LGLPCLLTLPRDRSNKGGPLSSYTNSSFHATLCCFLHYEGLPFADVLDADQIQQFCDQDSVHFGEAHDEIYSPAVTLWAWLSQSLSQSKSCLCAVARVLVFRVATDLSACSANSGAYCKARAKLPESFLRRLTYQVGAATEDAAPDLWRFKGRRVLLADGVEVTGPDTPANQAAYPQPTSQKKGLGFPMIRLVVLLTFATASLVGCAMGPYSGKETGETALFRSLLGQLRRGDIVVADRYYCSYWLLALLTAQGVDVCFRLHQLRKYDFRRGKRLGKGDHVVHWSKPKRPAWMDEETYAGLPDSLEVREVRAVVDNPGYRSKEILIATTLLDATVYAKGDISDLYHKRWHAELDIRSIKQTLKMDILSCKTPEMLRKEIWTHLLAYNLVRRVMAQAARQSKCEPRQLSFAAAVQTLGAFRWVLLMARGEQYGVLAGALLLAVGSHRVGNRPGRCEPRKVKRRPKSLGKLMRPRSEEKERLMSGKKEGAKASKKKG